MKVEELKSLLDYKTVMGDEQRIVCFLVPVHGHAVAAGTTGDAAASRELALGGGRDGTRAAGTHLCG